MITGVILYQSPTKDIIIVGKSHNSQGFPVEIENPTKLTFPYTPEELGEAILKSLKECEETPFLEKPMDDKILCAASGLKSLRAVGKIWESVSITKFPKGEGSTDELSIAKDFRFQGARFMKSNYLGTIHDPRCTIPLESTPEEIGSTTMRIFDEIVKQHAERAAKQALKDAIKEKRKAAKTSSTSL